VIDGQVGSWVGFALVARAPVAVLATPGPEHAVSVLKAQGNPVTLDLMPDTNHTTIGLAGWPVFLAAFENAAAKD